MAVESEPQCWKAGRAASIGGAIAASDSKGGVAVTSARVRDDHPDHPFAGNSLIALDSTGGRSVVPMSTDFWNRAESRGDGVENV
jgi:hypothetical protein